MKSVYFFENIIITLPTLRGAERLGICTKAEMDRISDVLENGGDGEVIAYARELVRKYSLKKTDGELPRIEYLRILAAYYERIGQPIDEHGQELMLPVIDSDGEECLLPSSTVAEKLVSEYTELDIFAVCGLNYLVFRLLLADAVKYNLSATTEGVKKLNAFYDRQFVPFDREKFLAGEW